MDLDVSRLLTMCPGRAETGGGGEGNAGGSTLAVGVQTAIRSAFDKGPVTRPPQIFAPIDDHSAPREHSLGKSTHFHPFIGVVVDVHMMSVGIM